MAKDPALVAHQQWLGYLQPVGLVVSPPALLQAQAFVNSHVAAEHERFLAHVCTEVIGLPPDRPAVTDLPALLTELFDWPTDALVPVTDTDPRCENLTVALTVYQETLRPTHAVRDPGGQGWMLLVQVLDVGTDLDAVGDTNTRHWHASPQTKFERLLRETGVPIGLLFNGTHLRLVYFPRNESPGYVTFPVEVMQKVAGRPALAALLMLLGGDRLFTLPDRQRLPALLAESRRYQNTVSTELAEQVLAALFELVRGFQAADDQRNGDVLRDVLAHDPDEVYAGLVAVLMRLVFLLYAEDRGLMSSEEVYTRNYSVGGLWERLREDESRYPDTMDQRYGGWAQLFALFRLVHDGGGHGAFRLPQRHGHLFKPNRYPFLEGRPRNSEWEKGKPIAPPLVSDGVLFRVLRNLLILDGDRLSYGDLNVEHIGSVYESIMGYRMEKAEGRSIALKPKKAHGAPVTVNLDALLKRPAADRGKWLTEHADLKLDGKPLAALKAADTVEGLVAALERRIARQLTPNIVPPGAMVLQPSDERRRSGSHYTPRDLTSPIVRKALEPVLKQLGDNPTPDDVLKLKVCDPAMGSGAFLVEACRQLGEMLLKAWIAHGGIPPDKPRDETPEIFALRTVAQRCLYGVDRNPMAVDLAKLSLWLATLAKDHPFTFLDHSLKRGDSLVGLTAAQIKKFHWKPGPGEAMVTGQNLLNEQIETATRHRWVILESGEYSPHLLKEQQFKLAEEAIRTVRFAGNLAVAAFFAADNDRKRNELRQQYKGSLGQYLNGDMRMWPKKEANALTTGPHPVTPFHWEIEFPEVFQGTDGGFHCIVGNPPFAGKNTIGDGNRDGYLDWLKAVHPESHGNADLVAHFFRRAFDLLRPGGTFGLIATNTIAQGDTRSTGLRWICTRGGTIYSARRRYKWPGLAAVVVSVVHVQKASRDRQGAVAPPYELDGKLVDRITAYLFHAGGHDDPAPLPTNKGKSFQGSIVLGMGFTFDDTDKDGVANPISLMHELIAKDPRNAERIFPYIGGEEVNDSPTHAHHRYVINFGEMTEVEARRWPDLMRIAEEKVRPERRKLDRSNSTNRKRSDYWWQYGAPAKELARSLKGAEEIIGVSRVGQAAAFTLLPAALVTADTVISFLGPVQHLLAVLQSRIHEVWARFFGSSMKDDLRYTPSDCFETFPFPDGFESHPELEAVGREYYEFRAALMVRHNEGLTKTYNRFHDPNETNADILRLRELHAAMDGAVLSAYGGPLAALTIPPCEFLLDYEDEDAEPTKRQRKKPWRYRWPDAFRDEVLALLLDLNKQRAAAELSAAENAPASVKKPRKRTKGAVPTDGDGTLFE